MNILPESEIPSNFLWPFAKEVKPRYNRRARWHDYTSRCFYMITISKTKDCPDFSAVAGSISDPAEPPRTDISNTGAIIRDQLYLLQNRFPILEISRFVIMPDHIHFIIYIKETGGEHLGKYINSYKGACTLAVRELLGSQEIRSFENGFHDRIVKQTGQLDSLRNYIADNPRRLMIKRENPNLFTNKYEITIDGYSYDAIGNLFLLRHPEISAVIVSSKYTEEEKLNLHKQWIRTIEEGGVVVSPFISPHEKNYRNLASDNGACIITLLHNGFPEKYKPSGRNFDLCAEGKLLIIAPKQYNPRKSDITRQEALFLNYLARQIEAGNFKASLKKRNQP